MIFFFTLILIAEITLKIDLILLRSIIVKIYYV